MQIFWKELHIPKALDLFRNLSEPVTDSFLGKSLTRRL